MHSKTKTALSVLAVFLAAIFCPAGLFAADGFGASATGGAGGTAVTVTTSAQLLQYAANSGTTRYIITVSGTISITGGSGGDGKTCKVGSNKTIQGADANATIIGCLDVNTVNNVIIQ